MRHHSTRLKRPGSARSFGYHVAFVATPNRTHGEALLLACEAGHAAVAVVALADEHQDCGGWAARGECDANPGFMLASCKRSCAAQVGKAISMR